MQIFKATPSNLKGVRVIYSTLESVKEPEFIVTSVWDDRHNNFCIIVTQRSLYKLLVQNFFQPQLQG